MGNNGHKERNLKLNTNREKQQKRNRKVCINKYLNIYFSSFQQDIYMTFFIILFYSHFVVQSKK